MIAIGLCDSGRASWLVGQLGFFGPCHPVEVRDFDRIQCDFVAQCLWLLDFDLTAPGANPRAHFAPIFDPHDQPTRATGQVFDHLWIMPGAFFEQRRGFRRKRQQPGLWQVSDYSQAGGAQAGSNVAVRGSL